MLVPFEENDAILTHVGRTNHKCDAFWPKATQFKPILNEKVAILTHFGRKRRHFDALWTKKSPF